MEVITFNGDRHQFITEAVVSSEILKHKIDVCTRQTAH